MLYGAVQNFKEGVKSDWNAGKRFVPILEATIMVAIVFAFLVGVISGILGIWSYFHLSTRTPIVQNIISSPIVQSSTIKAPTNSLNSPQINAPNNTGIIAPNNHAPINQTINQRPAPEIADESALSLNVSTSTGYEQNYKLTVINYDNGPAQIAVNPTSYEEKISNLEIPPPLTVTSVGSGIDTTYFFYITFVSNIPIQASDTIFSISNMN